MPAKTADMPLTSFRLSRTVPCPTALNAKDRCARSSTAWASSSRDRASTAPIPGTPREAPFRPLLPHQLHPRRQRLFRRLPRADCGFQLLPVFPHSSTFPHSSIEPCHGPACPVSVAVCQRPRTQPKAPLLPGLHRFRAVDSSRRMDRRINTRHPTSTGCSLQGWRASGCSRGTSRAPQLR